MKRKADVDVAVFEFLPPELKRYAERAERTRADVTRSMVAVERGVEDEVTDRRRAVAHAERELERCLAGDNDCSGYRRELERRRTLLEYALAALTVVQRAVYAFGQAQRRYDDNLRTNLDDGRKIVRAAAERVERYRKRTMSSSIPTISPARSTGRSPGAGGADTPAGTGSAGAGSAAPAEAVPVSWQDRPGVTVPAHYPPGFAEIPLALITRADSAGPLVFPKGQSVADMEWAVEMLHLVVVPAMRLHPDPRPYLRLRDSAEGRTGDRGYLRTYEGFFGSRAITVSPVADGTFDAGNGNHRIRLFERAGETTVPARITGGAS